MLLLTPVSVSVPPPLLDVMARAPLPVIELFVLNTVLLPLSVSNVAVPPEAIETLWLKVSGRGELQGAAVANGHGIAAPQGAAIRDADHAAISDLTGPV